MSEEVRILVLEDDEEMRENLATVLELEGYQVVAVGRGVDAVEEARKAAFDLVVADIRMKGISGLDALEQVRDRQPDIRSLVVTGYSTEADSIRAIRLGVGEYLKKPFDVDTFLEAVRRLVAARREQQKAAARERGVRRATLMALEALARALDPEAGLIGVGRLAARLAGAVGLSDETSEGVQLAALVGGLQRRHPESQPAAFIEALSPHVRHVVAEASDLCESLEDGREGGAVSLEAEAAALAQLAASTATETRGQGVERRWPGRFSSTLLDALDAGAPTAGSGGMDGGRRRRGLLSLARALEGAGEAEAARRAFRDVLEDGASSREAVEALLGIGRLSHAAGDLADAARMVRHAAAAAAQLGPVTAAETSLEAGLLLAQGGDKSARSMLESAATALERLQLGAGAARARLGLAVLTSPPPNADAVEASLRVLLQPEHVEEMSASAWLLPWLLEQKTRGDCGERAVRRLLRDHPTELERILSRLSVAARIAAARGLSSSASAHALLTRLASDPEEAVRREAQRVMQGHFGAPSVASSAARLQVLRIHSLGPFEVYRGDARVGDKEWQGRTVRHLLAYLAQAGRPVPIDVLLEQFWPEHLETGRKNLNWAVSILRRCLRSDAASDYIVRAGQSLQFNDDAPSWHDFVELGRSLESLRQETRDESAVKHARRALQLYRGPYLEDCYLDWALDIRNQTELRVFEAARRLCRVSFRLGQHLEVLEAARRVLELDPLDQEAYLLLMQSNIALGRPDEAVRQYNACRKMLETELGAEPSIEMLREHQRALIALSVPPR